MKHTKPDIRELIISIFTMAKGLRTQTSGRAAVIHTMLWLAQDFDDDTKEKLRGNKDLPRVFRGEL